MKKTVVHGWGAMAIARPFVGGYVDAVARSSGGTWKGIGERMGKNCKFQN